MGRLVVISNRVPKPGKEADAGGLAVALKGALASGGLWFGWSGATVAEEAAASKVRTRIDGNIVFAVADLTRRDVEQYYLGFSNRTLWPLLHFRTDLLDFRSEDYEGYMRVNRRFAQLVAARLHADDKVWIHDYHLIPLAAELRKLGFGNRIGFFLHVPWPPADIFSTLPHHRALLESFDAYDLIGFQTEHDAENFRGCVEREAFGGALGARVGTFPISIDTAQFAAEAAGAVSEPVTRRLGTSLRGRRLMIGVDRLDYTKGIDKRFEAFERFLKTVPYARGRFVFLQVTPKSRSEVPEYAALQTHVAELAGRINGAYSDLDWMPIRYLNRNIKRESLAGLYRQAAIGLVTPLRDGMNLVAKEFVAAQNGDDPGVLVLSRFAGAAAEMHGALLVNPLDIEGTAEAIRVAVEMPIEERRSRWRSMFDHLLVNDIVHWREAFLKRLAPWRPPVIIKSAI